MRQLRVLPSTHANSSSSIERSIDTGNTLASYTEIAWRCDVDISCQWCQHRLFAPTEEDMGTAIALLVSLILLPGVVKLVGNWEAHLSDRHREIHGA